MTERIPTRVYDELVDSIWCLQKATMSRTIALAPLPSVIRRETEHDGAWLELGLEVTKQDQHLRTDPPRMLSMAYGECVPYEPDPDFNLWAYEEVVLNPVGRKRVFRKGFQIFCADDATCIFPDTDRLPSGQSRRLGSLAWREQIANTDLQVFSVNEARGFIETATALTTNARDEA